MVSDCYIFNTKFVKDNERNGQKCWITEVTHVARNSQQDLVVVRFEDGDNEYMTIVTESNFVAIDD